MSRLSLAAALLAALVVPAACSDATGPAAESAHPLLVLRYTNLPEVWEYSGRVARRITLDSSGTVRDLAASSDGRLAVSSVSVVESGTVSVLVETTRDGRWLRTLERGDRPYAHGLAYSPNGQRLAWWATYGHVDSLFVLDAGAAVPRGVAQRPRRNDQPVVRWIPDGRIVDKAGAALTAIDPATGGRTTVFTSPDSILDFDFAADGRLVVAADPRTPPFGHLLAQRVPGGPVLPVVSAVESHREVARWSPDGQRIATTGTIRVREDGGVYERSVPEVLDLSGERSRVQTGPPGYFDVAGWTPDERLVFLAYPPSGTVETPRRLDVYVALPGGRTTNVTNTPDAYEFKVVIPR